MASADAWALLNDFRREWECRKAKPTDEDLAELLDDAIHVGSIAWKNAGWTGEDEED